jgi:hypothetical protein
MALGKLICALEAKNRGASAVPPNCKESSEISSGSGDCVARTGDESRRLPKAEAMLPGATGAV